MDDADEEVVVRMDLDPRLAERLTDAKRAYDECRAYYEELRNLVLDQLQQDGANRVDGVLNGTTICTAVSYDAVRFDSKAFKSQYPDIYRQFEQPKRYTSLRYPRGEGAE